MQDYDHPSVADFWRDEAHIIQYSKRKAGLFSRLILSGQAIVFEHYLGVRSGCEWCGAHKWNSETKLFHLCCLNGKICFPLPAGPDDSSPASIAENFVHNLWLRSDSIGKVARKYSRQLNNCLTLASQVVNEDRLIDGSFQPTVTTTIGFTTSLGL